MAGELQDKVAVVTAAASGMGRETSLRFAQEGARVVAIDIDADAGATLLDDIKADGGTAEFLTVDLTDLKQIEATVAHIESTHGRIDVLFNHVGAPGPRGFDFDADVWDFQVNLNLARARLPDQARPAAHGRGRLAHLHVVGLGPHRRRATARSTPP
jgi:NAD(P)-dependent dehydrogenase (short-subunit alcohol dehydrogenase family)